MSQKNKIYLGDIQLAANDDVIEGPSSSTNNHVAVFDGTTGKKIKDGTYTIGASVPSGAVFTDTKNTAGSTDDSSNLLYLIGAKTQAANPQTYSKSGLYINEYGVLNTPSSIIMGGYAVGTGNVNGPSSSVANRIATFSDTTGKVIKDSGYTIATSVPSGAVFTDTTYSSKTAASGGTDVSLCTTGEKYTWNNKSNLAIGTTATTAAAGNHTHTTTIAAGASGDTSQITLSMGSKYKLTAGGTDYVFTMPAGASSDIYWATYDTTLYANIKDAFDAGKTVLLDYQRTDSSNVTYHSIYQALYSIEIPSTVSGTSYISFYSTNGGGFDEIRVYATDYWSSTNATLQNIIYRASSITSSNKTSTSYYTSTKAVADYVDGKDPIKYPPGRYQVTKSGGSVDWMYCAHGNVFWKGSSGDTCIATLDNFYTAFMKSIGAYDSSASKTSNQKVEDLAYLMPNISIIKFPATSGTMGKISTSYLYLGYTTGNITSFKIGASASGARIEVTTSTVTLYTSS